MDILKRLKGDVIAYRSVFAKKVIGKKIKSREVEDGDNKKTQNVEYEIRFGVAGAIYLQQLLYWSDKGKRDDGFIYKSKEEIYDETGITPREQDTIRKQLVEFNLLEVKKLRANGSPTLHYKLNIENTEKFFLHDKTESIPDSNMESQTNSTPRSIDTNATSQSLTENTTEITTKSTTVQPVADTKQFKQDYSNQDRIIHYFYSKIAPSTAYGTRLSKSARESATLMLEQYTESEVCSAVDNLLNMCSSGAEQIKYVSRFESFANKIQVYAGMPKPKTEFPKFSWLASQEYSSLDNLQKELYWMCYKHIYGNAAFMSMASEVDENFLYGGYPENAKTIAVARLDIDRLCGTM